MSRGGGDFLSLLLATRQVLLTTLDYQYTSIGKWAKTSSLTRLQTGSVSKQVKVVGNVQNDITPSNSEAKMDLHINVTSLQPETVPLSTPLQRREPVAIPSTIREPLNPHPYLGAQIKIPSTSINQFKVPQTNLRENVPVASHDSAKSNSTTQINRETEDLPQNDPPPRVARQSKVPSNRVSRLWHYGTLAAGVGAGAVGEAFRRATGLSNSSDGGSVVLSPANIERIVDKLTRMRGAALKLGQMLSIQDNKMVPKELENVLLRVQNTANYMPDSQLQKTLNNELGSDWESRFESFSFTPIAAASIGQVHRATLPSGAPVAVKIQYPGVANSIDSDLDNLRTLILFSNFLPKGLYLDNTIRVARKELAWECDYIREADAMETFKSMIGNDQGLNVPAVIPHLSTRQVLTTEFVNGIPLGNIPASASQETRNSIATRVLRLALREVFEFKYMQTDPNWSNFLYEEEKDVLHLLDFGAARGFGDEFVIKYMNVLHAASIGDRDGCAHWSRELGFLTGLESQAMVQAHVNSILMLGEPFRANGPDLYDFGNQDVTNRVRAEIPLMLRERLTPPPEETYSLHRKLSGAFLLCTKLKAQVPCRDMFQSFRKQYID
ncbi:chaperone activity of bc1 complex-like protein [Phlyctochytrium arcticum]|nr:chaperone activity of bc1 complex-like protein [Phlyctochytrium arcticum]